MAYGLLVKKIKTKRIGGAAAWNLDLRGITESSFVISAGAGHDISFELDLVDRTGCQLILLDPSPTGCNTVANIELPKKIAFEPVALSDQTGYMKLAKPLNMQEGSWRVDFDGEGEKMPCTSISEIMERYEQKKLDLLKIDIEGFEYQVLKDIIRRKIPIRQICVEIHQGPEFGKTRWDRWIIIYGLYKLGYRLIYHKGWDHTFIHKKFI